MTKTAESFPAVFYTIIICVKKQRIFLKKALTNEKVYAIIYLKISIYQYEVRYERKEYCKYVQGSW